MTTLTTDCHEKTRLISKDIVINDDRADDDVLAQFLAWNVLLAAYALILVTLLVATFGFAAALVSGLMVVIFQIGMSCTVNTQWYLNPWHAIFAFVVYCMLFLIYGCLYVTSCKHKVFQHALTKSGQVILFMVDISAIAYLSYVVDYLRHGHCMSLWQQQHSEQFATLVLALTAMSARLLLLLIAGAHKFLKNPLNAMYQKITNDSDITVYDALVSHSSAKRYLTTSAWNCCIGLPMTVTGLTIGSLYFQRTALLSIWLIVWSAFYIVTVIGSKPSLEFILKLKNTKTVAGLIWIFLSWQLGWLIYGSVLLDRERAVAERELWFTCLVFVIIGFTICCTLFFSFFVAITSVFFRKNKLEEPKAKDSTNSISVVVQWLEAEKS